jgi:hypothetical protein
MLNHPREKKMTHHGAIFPTGFNARRIIQLIFDCSGCRKFYAAMAAIVTKPKFLPG